MIEKDVLQYLQSKVSLTTKLGGVGKIMNVQPIATAKMPWLCIEVSGGTDNKMGATKQQEMASMRIYVDAAATQMVVGREAIELAKAYLQDLRGDLYDTKDLHLKCGVISGYPGMDGSYRYSMTVTARFMVPYSVHLPV